MDNTNQESTTLDWTTEKLVEHLLEAAPAELEEHRVAVEKLAKARGRIEAAERRRDELRLSAAAANNTLAELLVADERDEAAIAKAHAAIGRIEAELVGAEREATVVASGGSQQLHDAESAVRRAADAASRALDDRLRILARHRGNELLKELAVVVRLYSNAASTLRDARERLLADHGIGIGVKRLVTFPAQEAPAKARTFIGDFETVFRSSDVPFFLSWLDRPAEQPDPEQPQSEPDGDTGDQADQAVEPPEDVEPGAEPTPQDEAVEPPSESHDDDVAMAGIFKWSKGK